MKPVVVVRDVLVNTVACRQMIIIRIVDICIFCHYFMKLKDTTKNGNIDTNQNTTRSSTNDTNSCPTEQYGSIYFNRLPVSRPVEQIKGK